MTELKGLDVESVTVAIEEYLRLNGIDHMKVVAKAYDGSSS